MRLRSTRQEIFNKRFDLNLKRKSSNFPNLDLKLKISAYAVFFLEQTLHRSALQDF
jgi:hypothetical protein